MKKTNHPRGVIFMLYLIVAWAGLPCLTARLEGGQQEDQMALEKLLNLLIEVAAIEHLGNRNQGGDL